MRAIESVCDVFVLGAADRASAVHHPLRGQRGGGLQKLALERRQLCERARIDAPAHVRSAPQHAQLGAGRIDEDEVGRARTIDDFDLPLCACASRAGPQALEALAVDVIREHARSLRSEEQRLSAGARAQIEDGLTGSGADEMAEKLASFVLGLEVSLAPGARPEQVRLRTADEERIRSTVGGDGIDPFAGQARLELAARAQQAIRAQTHRARNCDGGTERFRRVAELAQQMRLKPIGKRPAIGEPRRPFGLRGGRRRSGERERAVLRNAAEVAQQRCQQIRRRDGTGLPEKPSSPERDAEDRFHRSGPFVARQLTVAPQRSVDFALGRCALQDRGDGGQRDVRAERVPWHRSQSIHASSMSHERQPGCPILHADAGIRIFIAMDDPRQLLEEGRFEELAHDDHPLWRGLALLELKRWSEAARAFEEAPDAAQSGTMLELAGAARWLAGEREIGVERWVAALDAAYEGPASRLKPPALLVYAGTRLADSRYVLRGTRLLTKTWKPKIQRIWPGPVAGFLLGHVDEQSFLEDGYSDPDLEARRLASAHFWAALKQPQKAREHYEAAIENEGAAVLEVEHHLAHGELAAAAP